MNGKFSIHQLVVGCTIISISGCAVLAEKHDRKHPGPPAVVTTGGPYAVERTLQIPATGLTLGAAIDQSLRSGWSSHSITAGLSIGTRVNTKNTLPVAAQSISAEEIIRSAVSAVFSDVEGHQTNLDDRIRQNTTQMLSVLLPAISVDEEHRSAVVKEFERLKDFESLSEENIQKLKMEVADAIKSQLSALLPAPVPTPETLPTASEADAILGDDLVVVVTRRTGRSLIFPLDLVQRASGGDVWLAHGDRVTVTSLRRTSLNSETSSDSGQAIALTSLSAEPVALNAGDLKQLIANQPAAIQNADIVIVRRVNSRGGVDEFYLPVADNPLQPGFAFAQTCLNQVYVQGGDHVHFDFLDNTAIVRESRVRSQRVAAQQLVPKQKASLLAQLDPFGILDPLRNSQQELNRSVNQQLGQSVLPDSRSRLNPSRPALR